MEVRAFRGLRPGRGWVERLAVRPYDVVSSAEARAEAVGNARSLYHIIKPEIDFAEGTDERDARVYARGAANFREFIDKGWLRRDGKAMYYLYAQTMGGRTQYGLTLCAAVADYMAGRIKKHELTRRDKESDRMQHVLSTNANMEPVFFAYPDEAALDAIVARYAAMAPEYDFVALPEGFRHRLWLIDDDGDIGAITALFGEIPAMYIADGHHRSAAAALAGMELAKQNPGHRGDEGYNYFMAVCFPASQLTILDYNRVVKDLNGLTPAEFLLRVRRRFEVEAFAVAPKPAAPHHFALYVAGQWYALRAKADICDDGDPLGGLDVSLSSRYILDDILGITDLRTDKRIDFVGGIRGLGELQRRVDSGEMAMGLALYPVSMQQLMAVADAGLILPPKTTWFEPKLRSGLVVHTLD